MTLKIVLLPILMFVSLYADIKEEIQSNQNQISEKRNQEKKITHALDKIAKDMLVQKRHILTLSKEIKNYKAHINRLKKKSKIKSSQLDKIDKIYKKLAKQEKIVGKKVVGILSKELSIEMITKGNLGKDGKQILQSYETNVDNIIMNEVLHTYTGLLKAKFKKTKSKYIKLNKSMDLIKNEMSKLSNKVSSLREKQKALNRLKQKQKKSINALVDKKNLYVKQLKLIKKEQNILSQTLNSLNVTKNKNRQIEIQANTASKLDVRQIGSSYQQGELYKYRGTKTISPLKSYTVTQKFGNYTDPIYKMKIFNESVILRAKKQNAKVMSVLDGSVIYAEKTPILDNVIIVKHKNNLHTIYAHLSQIAPTIRVGKKVKKGYTIGRVRRELTFEATQDSKHINPMRLIK